VNWKNGKMNQYHKNYTLLNGNNKDNTIENLKLLCPNCHALNDKYRNRK